MRLICPNCDAQYEVDAAAIPMTGRDVQCSSCGHAWFQLHPDTAVDEDELDSAEVLAGPPDLPPSERTDPAEAEPIPASASVAPETSDPILAAIKDIAQPAAPVAEVRPAPPVPEPEPVADADEAAPSDQGPHPVHKVDDSLMAILREEAAREQAARRNETASPPVETQTDLGLPPGAAPVSPSVIAARERFADLSVTSTDDDDADLRPSSRRELLPDIEEINSTLRATSEPRGETGEAASQWDTPADSRTGFRTGFILAVAVAVGLWTTYAMAPQIVTRMPASAASMGAYVETVNNVRLGVDQALQAASRQLRRLSGEDGAAAGG
jgi:predicted Zn finger-like uncharacterized protein